MARNKRNLGYAGDYMAGIEGADTAVDGEEGNPHLEDRGRGGW